MIWAFIGGFIVGLGFCITVLLCLMAGSDPLEGCKPPYPDPGAGE